MRSISTSMNTVGARPRLFQWSASALLLVLAAGCAPSRTWDYLGMGVFVREEAGISTVPSQFAALIEQDEGVEVAIHSQERMEPQDIAKGLREDEALRQLVREAEVIVFDFSLEWINHPEGLYRAGMCGGADNQDCMRRGGQEAKDTWTSIVDQITALRAGEPVLLRVIIMGDYWLNWSFGPPAPGAPNPAAQEKMEVLSRYYRELSDFLEQDASRRGIPVVRAFPEPYFFESDPPDEYFGGIGGVHFSDEGSAALAQLLREVGYEPITLK